MRILLIEDNRRLNQSVKLSLEEDGYTVDAAFDGETGETLAEQTACDAIILDIGLPQKDGLAVCQELRDKRINTPILMLTARDTAKDRALGIDSGADDYLVKPFALNELRAHVQALLRPAAPGQPSVMAVDDLTLDPAAHRVTRAGRPIALSTKEYALLEYFMRNPDRLISREMAERHVWSYDFEGLSNVIDVAMRRLRRKVDDPFPTKLFETVRGVGYRLRPHAQ